MNRVMKPPLPQQLLAIVQKHFDLEISTLKTRNNDRMDFHEIAVWNIDAMLRAAYELGWKVGAGKEEK